MKKRESKKNQVATLLDKAERKLSISSDGELILEEYKHLIAERRFIMTRYMQFLIFYPIIVGYSFKELLSAESIRTALLIMLFIFLVNSVCVYGATRFRSMAYHALDREVLLADKLGMQRPHPKWGYRAGMYSFIVCYGLTILIILGRIFNYLDAPKALVVQRGILSP
ncbi:MAG: hypothetical protein DMF61_13315 [Blastocatellia bacterium AA13]|nr:MAG: hypothetical protein DMF61_13315 [Blastocatellia bacterium AA13]